MGSYATAKLVLETQDCYAGTDKFVMDLQSANALVSVYDALNDTNKVKLDVMDATKAALTAWKLIEKAGAK